MQHLIGKTLGKYRIVARLGRGGMAEVYKAFQPGLNRYVAIKVMHDHLSEDAEFIKRFQREALATGKLSHPNIVQALDFDEESGVYYMVMQYIDGPTLKDEIKARLSANWPFSLPDIARMYLDLCDAIDYAHNRKMIHRDIKPANMMIDEEGQILLTDFGIARLVGGTQFTATGAMTGTPAYMSPEQGQGEKVDGRSDIYTMGVILYELVTGQVPYEADTPIAVVMKHITDPLPLPRTVNPKIPEAVEAIILKAMAKSPEDRFQTANAMARALRDAVGLPPGDTLRHKPLKPLALPPKIVDELNPTTGSFTAANTLGPERNEVTIMSSGSDSRPMVALSASSSKLTPVFYGIMVFIMMAMAGGFGYFALGRSEAKTSTPVIDVSATAQWQATQTAIAVAQLSESEATATAVWLAGDNDRDGLTNAEEIELNTLPDSRDTDQDDIDDADEVNRYGTNPLRSDSDGDGLKDGFEISQGLNPISDDTDGDGLPDNRDPDPASSPTPTVTNTPLPSETPLPTNTLPPTQTLTPGPTATATATPTATSPPTATPLPAMQGRIALPVDNGAGGYNVVVYDLAEQRILFEIPSAHQPNFSNDGRRLLVDGLTGNASVLEFRVQDLLANPRCAAANTCVARATDGAEDLHPYYYADAQHVVFDSPQRFGDPDLWRLFVRIGPDLNNVISIKVGGIEVQASNVSLFPLWHDDFGLVSRACGYWVGGNGSCGVWHLYGLQVDGPITSMGTVSGAELLIEGADAIPTDLNGNTLVYMSNKTGDWEVYRTTMSGGRGTNVSNMPGVDDGLATLSPDGAWVAFMSNRSGKWDVWIAPSAGGEATPLNINKPIRWHQGDHLNGFADERLSWGDIF